MSKGKEDESVAVQSIMKKLNQDVDELRGELRESEERRDDLLALNNG